MPPQYMCITQGKEFIRTFMKIQSSYYWHNCYFADCLLLTFVTFSMFHVGYFNWQWPRFDWGQPTPLMMALSCWRMPPPGTASIGRLWQQIQGNPPGGSFGHQGAWRVPVAAALLGRMPRRFVWWPGPRCLGSSPSPLSPGLWWPPRLCWGCPTSSGACRRSRWRSDPRWKMHRFRWWKGLGNVI